MDVKFDFENALFEIQQELSKIPSELKSQTKPILNKAAKIVKKNVEAELSTHKTSLTAENTNYDGTPYVHMADDVKTSVRDDKEGTIYAVIKGGKYTGYKWHLVNNGTVNSRATHFIDKVMKQSENEVNSLIDEMISKVVQDGR